MAWRMNQFSQDFLFRTDDEKNGTLEVRREFEKAITKRLELPLARRNDQSEEEVKLINDLDAWLRKLAGACGRGFVLNHTNDLHIAIIEADQAQDADAVTSLGQRHTLMHQIMTDLYGPWPHRF